MGESFVCFCHLVHFVFSLASAACIVQCVQNFACQTINHCLLAAFSGIQCDPSQTQCLSSFRSDFHGYLVGCTADTASLNLELRHDVLHCLLESFQSVLAGLLSNDLKCAVNDLLGYALLSVEHDIVYQSCYELRAVHRIRKNFTLRNYVAVFTEEPVMLWFKNTRAWTLFKGLIVILVFVFVAALFQMNTILWIAGKAFNVGIVALVVVFQPELRKALEDLGRKNFVSSIVSIDFSRGSEEKFSERTVNELVKACYEMGKVKTGALIVIENDVSLAEYERTGITLDSILTSQLLINIFEKNTPLHDGAIIVRGDRVVSATCYLPLSDNMELSKELGTRHRAAVGISEVSDSLTIVVSEETGKVSIATQGVLYRNVDADFLRSKLDFLRKHDIETNGGLDVLKRRLKNAKKIRQRGNK